MMVTRLGIVGIGVVSRYYVEAISACSCVEFVAACDINSRNLELLQGLVEVATCDIGTMLRADGLDGVIVNVPNHLHYQVCLQALNAGKHVCCEKPLTLDLESARHLVHLAKYRNLTLFTAFHRRYNHHIRSLARRIGSLETIQSVHARYFEKIEDHCGNDNWYLDPQRCGGGVIADNGPNLFDTVRYLLGGISVVRSEIEYVDHGLDIRAEIFAQAGTIPIRLSLDWAYGAGEVKDVLVQYRDGSLDYADMLTGYPGFKSSLNHEYIALLEDFVQQLRIPANSTPDGLEIIRLVRDAYVKGQRSGVYLPKSERFSKAAMNNEHLHP